MCPLFPVVEKNKMQQARIAELSSVGGGGGEGRHFEKDRQAKKGEGVIKFSPPVY